MSNTREFLYRIEKTGIRFACRQRDSYNSDIRSDSAL